MLTENTQLEGLGVTYEWADMAIDTEFGTEPEVKAECMMGMN